MSAPRWRGGTPSLAAVRLTALSPRARGLLQTPPTASCCSHARPSQRAHMSGSSNSSGEREGNPPRGGREKQIAEGKVLTSRASPDESRRVCVFFFYELCVALLTGESWRPSHPRLLAAPSQLTVSPCWQEISTLIKKNRGRLKKTGAVRLRNQEAFLCSLWFTNARSD